MTIKVTISNGKGVMLTSKVNGIGFMDDKSLVTAVATNYKVDYRMYHIVSKRPIDRPIIDDTQQE